MADRTSVLILDDDVAIRAIVRQTLEPEFAVSEARDAAEAMNALRVVSPSVILVDLLLPGGMNGEQFIERFRRSGGRARLVLFTGNPRAEEIGRELRVDGVIKKPFDAELLPEQMRALVSKT